VAEPSALPFRISRLLFDPWHDGHGVTQVMRSVIFRAELSHYLMSGMTQSEIHQPGLEDMLTTYSDGRSLLHVSVLKRLGYDVGRLD
jgi:hypothetical protein